MVLRRFNGKVFLARWPDTGERHSSGCPSYDPSSNPAAVHELEDGGIEIRASFSLSASSPRQNDRPALSNKSRQTETVVQHEQLDLAGVLHELWRRASFDKWFPAMAGRRNWGVVKHHLSIAASAVHVGPWLLGDHLLAVDKFSRSTPGFVEMQTQRLRSMIDEHGVAVLLAPVKSVERSRFGIRVEFFHLPSVSFYKSSMLQIGEQLRCLPAGHRLIALAIIDVRGRNFHIRDAGAITVTSQWLPYDMPSDAITIEALVAHDQRFMVRHGHIRENKEVAIKLGGVHDGAMILSDPSSNYGYRITTDGSILEGQG